MTGTIDRPLSGIRIVDIVHGPLAAITRYLAELGATVDRIDPAEAPADTFADLAANAGKRRHDLVVDSDEVRALIDRAHVVVANADQPVDLAALFAARPDVVAMTVSDFGQGNSLSGWQATGPVLHALSGELARSGIRGQSPLLPPGDLAYQCSASQAAYTLTVSLYRALRTGTGDHIDFSALDGAVQALDPGYGISGSATMGKPAHLLSRDRPPRGFQYPILPCADGHVRICLLAKRQWQGMFKWMGEPEAFASPEFEKIGHRYKSPELIPAIAAFFEDKTRDDLEAGARAHGVPLSALLDFEECIETEHFRVRDAVTDVAGTRLPNGVITVDGARMGLSDPADGADFPRAGKAADTDHPFDGLKVLDLGVIVVGAEAGRLLGDQGADVIKVESAAYPDGNRQSYLSYGMSVSFAAGHRNKRSLGINLRDAEGRALFLEMAKQADVILSNFKPGTMDNLGLGHDVVAAVNPGIVMVDSSAFGSTGPWAGRMGYGPLVRAATGLTLAWRYPHDPESFSDSVTIYPDHVAGRMSAMAAVALLIRRLRTGQGGTASVAQSEVMLGHFAADVARVSSGGKAGGAPDWPYAVYPAAGEDEWCVVSVRDDADWAALADTIGYDGAALDSAEQRLANRDQIDAAITAWLAGRSAQDAEAVLQAVGVPAARMLRVAELPGHDYYRERGFYRVEGHPFLNEDVVAERGHAQGENLAEAPSRPAPLAGEQSGEIVADWLKRDDAAIADLIDRAILEPVDPETLSAAQAGGRVAEQATA